MIDPVNCSGNPLTYPLKPCDCGAGCGAAIDQSGTFAYERSTLCGQSKPIQWADIQNEPGWQNGYPPGYGGKGVGTTTSMFFLPGGKVNFKPVPDMSMQPDVCDCGMAASDYSVSRDGGPGHSDWCKVVNK
jgi:hypothetical protein